MKLSQINYTMTDRIEFELIHPKTNEPQGGYITVLSIETPEGHKVKLDIERLKSQRITDGLKPIETDELVDACRFLFKPLVVGIREIEYEDGKKVKADDKGIEYILNNDIAAMLVWANAINVGNFFKEK